MESIKKKIALFVFLLFVSFYVSSQNAAIMVTEVGNVGIGTEAATEKLDVSGNARVRENLSIEGNFTVAGVGHAYVPRGAILMWSGSIEEIPEGWVLCDGQSHNIRLEDDTDLTVHTPDLRSRFIVGASPEGTVLADGLSPYPVGAKDVNGEGEEKHTLTVEEMPAHDHGGSNNYTNTDGAHRHYTGMTSSHTGNTKRVTVGWDESQGAQYTATDGAHRHRFTIPSEGGGQAHENRPPYFALAFIMKT